MDTLLPPLRVLDLSDEKGFLCGRLLADLGCDVVKIEPPGGDPARRFSPFYGVPPHPERSVYWMSLNSNKRGITLDLEQPDGQQLFLKLVEGCDIVVETHPPGYLDGLGLGYSALEKVNPGVILTSLTPFGQSGPYKHYKTSDLVALALGGVMSYTGEPERAPLRMFLDQAYFLSSTWAATGAALAYFYREAAGVGQHVDISIHECMVRLNYRPPIYWEFQKTLARRMGNLITRGVNVSVPMIWPCRDGFVSWVFYAGLPGVRENRALANWLTEEGLGADLQGIVWEEMDFARLTQQELDLLMEPVKELFSRHTKQELWEGGVRREIRISVICDLVDVSNNPQLHARNYWIPVEHEELGATLQHPGHLFLSPLTEGRPRRRAPLIGEHNREVLGTPGTAKGHLGHSVARGKFEAAPLPLRGIRVLDFTWAAAGPFATKFLADYGAEVIKVETCQRPDILRVSEPYRDGKPGIDNSGFFVHANTGKKGISLNLSTPQGRELALRLAGLCDVVIENFSPGVMKRLGLDYPAICRVKPDIIMLSSSIFGNKGAAGGGYEGFRGFGMAAASASGHYYYTGWEGGEPAGPTHIAYGDIAQAVSSSLALISALDHRRRTGKGQYIDACQLEVMTHFLGPAAVDYLSSGRLPRKLGNRHPDASPHGAFRCQGEDRWCAIACLTEQEWQSLCRVMEDPGLATDPRFSTMADRKAHEDELEGLVEAWTSDRSAEEVMGLMQQAGVPAGVVQTAADIVDTDPQLKARNAFITLPHPVLGECLHPIPPVLLTKSPPQVRTSPCFGEHNAYVFGELLGLPEHEMESLALEGVFD